MNFDDWKDGMESKRKAGVLLLGKPIWSRRLRQAKKKQICCRRRRRKTAA